MRPIIAKLALASALLLTACLAPAQPAAQPGAAETTPTADLGQPDGVAITFLDAWEQGNYEGMYGLLSPKSQAEYSLENFTLAYQSASETMTLISLEAAPLSALPETTGTTAQLAFRVTYNTLVLGDIERELTMRLVLDGGRWGVSWSPALIFAELAGGNLLQLEVETPSRANIYDRNGLWFVSADAAAVTLTVVPQQINTAVEEDMLILLSSMLRQPVESIRQQYAGLPADWQVALGDVDLETFNNNRSTYYSYPGLDAFEKTGRRYYNLLAPHVLGYTSYVPAEQCEAYQARGYRCDEIVGLAGIEFQAEEYLAGKRGGTLSAYTPSGQFFAQIASSDPEAAQSVYLTLDRDLQVIAQDALEEAYTVSADTWANSARGAAIVIMDAKTGAIRAMVSYPYFDPNVLNPFNVHPLAQTGSYFTTLANDPLRPLFNRATQGEYPAGSTFKIVSAAAALESDIYDLNSTYTSVGVWEALGPAGRKFDWRDGGHGTLNLAQALTASCNSCFYDVGYRTGQADFNIIPNTAREFGFGTELGLGIAEESGNVPVPANGTSDGRQWGLLDSVNLAIGQGDLLVTPLQVATMTTAIANGGTVYRPYLIDRVGLIGEEPVEVFEPEVLNTLALTPEEIAFLREGMRQVPSDPTLGTAEWRLGSMEIDSAGKTGTAQVSLPGAQPIAWYTGFVPYDDPELVITVMIENGGQGSGVAAPIFRRIVERWYDLPVLRYPNDWGDEELFEFVDDEFGELTE